MNPAGLRIRRPAKALAPFVSHYWLGLDNCEPVYTARPDGCVDIVLEVTGSHWRGWAYGTTTRPTDIACKQGSHYLGIRFKPGQSRRQVERVFLQTIGVSSKFFATLVRARCAARLIVAQPQRALCDLAAETGYADQSHMTRDLVRLTGTSPARLRREDVAFLQYAPSA